MSFKEVVTIFECLKNFQNVILVNILPLQTLVQECCRNILRLSQRTLNVTVTGRTMPSLHVPHGPTIHKILTC